MDLEEVWRIREEEIYPSLFGPVNRGIFTLGADTFSRIGRNNIDPRWLFMGVFEFAPNRDRSNWLYVTSGYSNPWEVEPENFDPARDSGSGIEFTLETSEQGDWAIRTLLSMLAFDVLLSVGNFPNSKPLAIGDRIPLRSSITGLPGCLIRNLILVEREEGSREFNLPSGKVALARFAGITDSELAFAKENSSAALCDRLKSAGCYTVTDPHRNSVA